MLRCVATLVNAYMEGLGPVNITVPAIRTAPGNRATSCSLPNPAAGKKCPSVSFGREDDVILRSEKRRQAVLIGELPWWESTVDRRYPHWRALGLARTNEHDATAVR